MEVFLYNPEAYDHVHALLLSNGEQWAEHQPGHLPKLGIIVFDSATPIAAGFLRMVEGEYAQIDTLVSNAGLSGQLRHEGITMVVNDLIERAKVMKLKAIYAHTADEGIMRRAAKLGFNAVNQVIIALPL